MKAFVVRTVITLETLDDMLSVSHVQNIEVGEVLNVALNLS
jgi:hypothetical protein